MKKPKVVRLGYVVLRESAGLFWGTVKISNTDHCDPLHYDTDFFDTIAEVKKECKEFCKWKKIRIESYLNEE